jgi:hypothetical protein
MRRAAYLRQVVTTAALVCGLVVALRADTQIFYDTMGGTGDVAAGSHDPDVGSVGAWTEVSDTCTTYMEVRQTLGYAHANDNLADCELLWIATPDSGPATANYYVRAVMANGTGTTNSLCLLGRVTDGDHYYAGCLYGNSANPDAVLYLKDGAATYSTLGSGNCGVSTGPTTFTLRMDGTAISFSDGASCSISVTNSALSSTGNAGAGWGSVTGVATDDVNVNLTLDNFEIVSIASATSSFLRLLMGVG